MRLYPSTPIDRAFFISLRRQYAQLVTSGAQLLLLAVGIHLHNPTAWLWCLGIMALISLLAWFSALHRLRTINGTPTSKVASAAQGYVELIGKGNYFEGTQIISPLSPLPCLWYRYKVERKNSKNQWTTESSGESDAPFLLDDGSAACVVDPTGAEIITSNKDTWTKGAYRYTEWKLLNIDKIYAIGEFKTLGGSTDERRNSDEIKAVLAEWKLNMPELHARFDLNGDGELDMQEWGLARSAAKREAEKVLTQARSAPDIHYLVRPGNGRLFLISNLAPDKLARRYAIWAWAHLVIFFGALGGMVWVLQQNRF
jgi:hypothetical protein